MAITKAHVELRLAALIDAISLIMGEVNISVCQCPLAMDIWLHLVIEPILTMLGLTIYTHWLMAAIPSRYVMEVRDIINSTWHKN